MTASGYLKAWISVYVSWCVRISNRACTCSGAKVTDVMLSDVSSGDFGMQVKVKRKEEEVR